MLSHMRANAILCAKAMRSYVEKMITWAKDESFHKRRQALPFIYEEHIVYAMFAEVAESFIGINTAGREIGICYQETCLLHWPNCWGTPERNFWKCNRNGYLNICTEKWDDSCPTVATRLNIVKYVAGFFFESAP